MHYLYVQYACQSRYLDFVEICDGNHQIQYLTLAKQVLLTSYLFPYVLLSTPTYVHMYVCTFDSVVLCIYNFYYSV